MNITNVLLPEASRTMKRIIFISVLVFFGFITYSPSIYSQGLSTVGVEKAKTVAIRFCLNTDSKYARISEKDLGLSLTETKTINNNIIYYIFNINREDGYIIISADLNSPPVLCYVPQGSFNSDPEKRPPAFNEWLEAFTFQIESSVKNPVKNARWQDLWNVYISKGHLDSETLLLKLTSKWNQTGKFNYYSPVSDNAPGEYNNRCPAGCVATAFAQILKYYQWPLTHASTHSYNDPANPNPLRPCESHNDPSFGEQSFSKYSLTRSYDYSIMDDEPNSINYEISKLIYHSAVSVNMDYAATASWTNTYQVEDALRTYWGYNNTVDYVEKSTKTDQEWEDLLIEQIRQERPVQYRGANIENCSGHSWVCHGYTTIETAKLFWFNWGWEGSSDGYFNIVSGDYPLSNFKYFNGAVINIFPTSQPNLTIPTATGPGGTVISGSPFTVYFNISNNGSLVAPASTTAFYLSTDAVLDKYDTHLSTLSVESLIIGANVPKSKELTISVGDGGTYYILIEVDTDHYVHESDESSSDNVKSVEITVGGSPALTGAFRSLTSGNWSNPATWEYYNGSGWITPPATYPSSTSGQISILSGHTVTMLIDGLSVDEVEIASGGKVTVNNATLTIANGTGDDFVVNGTLELTGTGIVTSTGNLVFNAGSAYIHNRDGGSIPIAAWNVTSNCNITGIRNTGPTVASFAQNFGDFTWNCDNQAVDIFLSGQLTTISGNLNILSTNNDTGYNLGLLLGTGESGNLTVNGNYTQSGTSTFVISGGTAAREMTVEGAFSLSGGAFYVTGQYTGAGTLNVIGDFSSAGTFYFTYNNTATAIVDVTGNCSITGGTFNMSNTSGIGTLNLIGNFSHTGGQITSGASGTGNIIFDGTYNGSTGMQTYTSVGMAISTRINYTVNSEGYLQMGSGATPSYLIGTGTFTLASGATLGITSSNGIVAGTTRSGNIQTTGGRQYNAGANYIYNGSANQAVGSGLPATLNSLTVANTGSSGSNTVTLAQNTEVNGNLSINSGVLDLGSYTCSRPSSGGSLTVASGAGLKIGGANTMPANYSAHDLGPTSTVFYTGISGGQTVSPEVYGNLSLDNTSGINILNENITVSGTLTTKAGGEGKVGSGSFLDAATVINAGNLTLDPMGQATITTLTNNGKINCKSDASGISSLLINDDTYDGTGTFDIQLYLTGGGGDNAWKWHYISSPVQNTPITVFNGNTTNLARYDESLVITSQNQGWVAADGYIYENPNSLTRPAFTELQVGKGYAYYYGSETPQLYTISGSVNANDVNVPLSYDTGGSGILDIIGFNLVGNPFTCTFDWSVVDDNLSSQISKAIYTTKDYTLYPAWNNGAATDGGTPYIVPMQAFFVEALASGQTLNLPVSAKSHDYDGSIRDRFKGDEEAIPLVRLLLEGAGNSRDAVVRFDEKAQLTFDGNFDAYSLGRGLGPMSIWTKLNGIDYAINAIPYPETSIDIPVGIHAENAGTLSLRSNELNGLENYNVTLKDKMTNTVIDLKKGDKLVFSTSAGEFEDRFVLTISNITTGSEEITLPENLFNIYALNGILNIVPLSDEWNGKSGSIRIADIMGKSITDNRNIEFWKNSLIQVPVQGAKGIYFVEIRSGVMRYVGKVMIK